MLPRLALLIFSSVLALGFAELLLARVAPQRTEQHILAQRAAMFRDSDVFISELQPGFRGREREGTGEFDMEVAINSQGYRGREIAADKGEGLRVLAVGDSFTFGHGVQVEQAWPALLEQMLDEARPGGVEVVNAGVPGRYPDEYYLELAQRGLALDPDLVVVGLYVKNDLESKDARNHVWTRVDRSGLPLAIEDPQLRIENGHPVMTHRKARWTLPVVRNSHLAQLFYDAGRALVQRVYPKSPKNQAIYLSEYGPETQAAFDRVRGLLGAMQRLAREHGADFKVVIIPAREQWLNEPSGDLDLARPQAVLAEALEADGIDYLDLLPAFRSSGREGLYFEIDTHWSAAGNAVAARAIADYLLDSGAVGEASGAEST